MIEMTCLNTIIPCLRVTADRPPDLQALLCGSSTCTLQRSRGGYPREMSLAALSKVEIVAMDFQLTRLNRDKFVVGEWGHAVMVTASLGQMMRRVTS